MELLQRISFTLLFLTLIGCGGGSIGGGDTPTDPVITVTLAISDANVSEASEEPSVVSATVKKDGVALANTLVTFEINNTDLAVFDPAVGSASTNSEGIATIEIKAGGVAGAGEITATASGETSTALAFTSAGDGNNGVEPKIAEIGLFASSQQLASSGAQSVTLTAIAKDVNNNLLEGVEVVFVPTSGSIQVVDSVTQADGKATAILKTENEHSNRLIEVTATSGSVTDTVDVQVVGTSIVLTGSSSLAINDSNNFIIKVLDSDGNVIANQDVALSLSGESTATPEGAVAAITIPETVKTDFNGQAIVAVVGTSGGTNSIIASTLGATTSHDVAVQADSFLFTGFNNNDDANVDPRNTITLPDVKLSNQASISLTWLRNNAPVADGTLVNFTSTRGTVDALSGTTVDGVATVNISSTNAGPVLVTFAGEDGDISLTNQLAFEFVAETVDRIDAQAFPESIGPSGQTSTVSVVVKDSQGNLVKNKTIDFSLTDTNGGSIFPASAVTDSNGSASTVYTSNTVSAKQGISIQATVRENPAQNATVNLTVAERELFIALGTGNEIIEHDSTTYNKQYSVFVTDANSAPVENVTLTVSAIPTEFYKGQWIQVYDGDEFLRWDAFHTTIDGCANEDLNLDGILDVGEDINGDGQLTPGNVVSAAGSTGEITTDSQGRAVIDILYAQSYAQWININLVLRTKVTGTETITNTRFTLPVSGEDVSNEDVAPPIANIRTYSPFGFDGSCENTD